MGVVETRALVGGWGPGHPQKFGHGSYFVGQLKDWPSNVGKATPYYELYRPIVAKAIEMNYFLKYFFVF